MNIQLSKQEVFSTMENELKKQGFSIVDQDRERPWGGFFVIDENQAQQFSTVFFNGLNVQKLIIADKLSPKILIVMPNKKLSWQYHYRRSELWQVVKGTVGVITSFTDEEGELKVLRPGDKVELVQGERHRLVGLQDWGILAEIWQHIDPKFPSDEEDIVRVQDDFGR